MPPIFHRKPAPQALDKFSSEIETQVNFEKFPEDKKLLNWVLEQSKSNAAIDFSKNNTYESRNSWKKAYTRICSILYSLSVDENQIQTTWHGITHRLCLVHVSKLNTKYSAKQNAKTSAKNVKGSGENDPDSGKATAKNNSDQADSYSLVWIIHTDLNNKINRQWTPEKYKTEYEKEHNEFPIRGYDLNDVHELDAGTTATRTVPIVIAGNYQHHHVAPDPSQFAPEYDVHFVQKSDGLLTDKVPTSLNLDAVFASLGAVATYYFIDHDNLELAFRDLTILAMTNTPIVALASLPPVMEKTNIFFSEHANVTCERFTTIDTPNNTSDDPNQTSKLFKDTVAKSLSLNANARDTGAHPPEASDSASIERRQRAFGRSMSIARYITSFQPDDRRIGQALELLKPIEELVDDSLDFLVKIAPEHQYLTFAESHFGNAAKVLAVSVDTISRFWQADSNNDKLMDYIRSHPEDNTVRLFVFSNAQSLIDYHSLLNQHFDVYEKVLVTNIETYRWLTRETSAKIASIHQSTKQLDSTEFDFGLIQKRPGNTPPDLDENEEDAAQAYLTLNSDQFEGSQLTAATSKKLGKLPVVLAELQEKFVDSLAIPLEPIVFDGSPDKLQEEYKRTAVCWGARYKVPKSGLELFKNDVVEKLFPNFRDNRQRQILHTVVFAIPRGLSDEMQNAEQARYDGVMLFLEKKLNELQPYFAKKYGLESYHFGMKHEWEKTDDLVPFETSNGNEKKEIQLNYLDGRNIRYYHAAVFPNVDSLKAYLADEKHIELRRQVWRKLDDRIEALYQAVDDSKLNVADTAAELMIATRVTRRDFYLRPQGKSWVNGAQD